MGCSRGSGRDESKMSKGETTGTSLFSFDSPANFYLGSSDPIKARLNQPNPSAVTPPGQSGSDASPPPPQQRKSLSPTAFVPTVIPKRNENAKVKSILTSLLETSSSHPTTATVTEEFLPPQQKDRDRGGGVNALTASLFQRSQSSSATSSTAAGPATQPTTQQQQPMSQYPSFANINEDTYSSDEEDLAQQAGFGVTGPGLSYSGPQSLSQSLQSSSGLGGDSGHGCSGTHNPANNNSSNNAGNAQWSQHSIRSLGSAFSGHDLLNAVLAFEAEGALGQAGGGLPSGGSSFDDNDLADVECELGGLVHLGGSEGADFDDDAATWTGTATTALSSLAHSPATASSYGYSSNLLALTSANLRLLAAEENGEVMDDLPEIGMETDIANMGVSNFVVVEGGGHGGGCGLQGGEGSEGDAGGTAYNAGAVKLHIRVQEGISPHAAISAHSPICIPGARLPGVGVLNGGYDGSMGGGGGGGGGGSASNSRSDSRSSTISSTSSTQPHSHAQQRDSLSRSLSRSPSTASALLSYTQQPPGPGPGPGFGHPSVTAHKQQQPSTDRDRDRERRQRERDSSPLESSGHNQGHNQGHSQQQSQGQGQGQDRPEPSEVGAGAGSLTISCRKPGEEAWTVCRRVCLDKTTNATERLSLLSAVVGVAVAPIGFGPGHSSSAASSSSPMTAGSPLIPVGGVPGAGAGAGPGGGAVWVRTRAKTMSLGQDELMELVEAAKQGQGQGQGQDAVGAGPSGASPRIRSWPSSSASSSAFAASADGQTRPPLQNAQSAHSAHHSTSGANVGGGSSSSSSTGTSSSSSDSDDDPDASFERLSVLAGFRHVDSLMGRMADRSGVSKASRAMGAGGGRTDPLRDLQDCGNDCFVLPPSAVAAAVMQGAHAERSKDI